MPPDDKRQTLDIPNGTTFEFRDGKLIFGHDSDIVIRTNMGGYKFQKIFSKRGSVQVIPPDGVEFDVEEIEALNGDIFFNGRVKARTVRAKTIHFQDGALEGDSFEAADEAVLSGKRIDIVRIKAPRVVIDGDAAGTCLVVESQTDLGKVRTKGGFKSMDEARQAFDRFQRAQGDAKAAAAATAPVAAPARPSSPARTELAPVRPSAPSGDPDATIMTSRSDSRDQTDEFRAPFGSPTPSGSGDAGSPQPVLPKSSVFRKRT
jgi:hypothetical protein